MFLEAQEAGYRAGSRWLMEDFSCRFSAGNFYALLGLNGAGKTTLLRMLSRELAPSKGQIRLNSRPLGEFSQNDLAKFRGYLSQTKVGGFPYTAYEIVMMGRFPHLQGVMETDKDHEIVKKCMGKMDVAQFASRKYPTLSGGEGHRVDAARTLAQ